MKNKNLARRVKETRKRRGFSQEELAENSRLSLRTIQRIESGETEPTGDTLKRISGALNISPKDLIDWAIVEDRGFLKAMNLSTLSFLLFPLLGILIPLIMWISKKDKLRDINKIGKNIINFELTWTLVLFAGLVGNTIFLIRKISSTGQVSADMMTGHHSFALVFLLGMYTVNTLLIIINTYRIQKEKEVLYYPRINFVRN